ncbi:MAG: hypothetical protein J6Q02_01575 [Lachnospiraceae bacterium]|nr:hypothetical protein [Lachnospiraceae bacterium]
MSTRILDAYLYDKPEEELMKELNSIRDAFHEYLKADIKKDPNKWMRWGKSIVDRGKETGEDSLRRAIRYIKAGLETAEVGDPLDVAANCVVIKHLKKIVLWFFPGMNFQMFAKENEILKRIHKNEYWWTDSADCEWDSKEEERAYNKRGRFWKSAFEHFQTYVPSRMGLSYEFFSHEDVFRVGSFLHMEYESYLKRGGK